jgi:hypothetical protein
MTTGRRGRNPAADAVLLGALLILVAGCGSRYRPAECAGNPFPDAKELLRLPGFERLRYFKGTIEQLGRIEHEMWADGRFDFDVSLRYHYPQEADRPRDCVAGVSLLLRKPRSPDEEALATAFISFFERRLSTDLGPLRAAYAAHPGPGAEFSRSDRLDLGGVVAEVVGLHSPARGDFLSVAFYERRYYESIGRLSS